ncbi:MAG: hypothetical protein U1F68_06335 [Gammaproteobacteria bacterium]
MSRLKRPLNAEAVKKADDEFYANHPEFVKDGKRIPLSADDPAQAALREEWVKLYEKNNGKVEQDDPKPPAKKPAAPVQPCPVKPTVKITPPCRFIGKNKPHEYKAVGTPAGGTYKWKTTGKTSVASGGGAQQAKIKGNAVSTAKDDSEITVEYTYCGETATDTLKVTVYDLSKVEATLERSPCRGAAAGDMPAKSSTKDSKTFDASAVTIVRGCGDLKLTATIAPAGVPVSWDRERAADDANDLTGLPSHAADGSDTKHKLTADAVGSFHVIAYVDCDGDGKRNPDEGAIILNVNIVDVEVTPGAANNQIITRNTLFRNNRSTAGTLVVDSGSTGGVAPGTNTAYTDAEFAKHPLAMKMTVRLVGAAPTSDVERIRYGLATSKPRPLIPSPALTPMDALSKR